MKLLLMEEGNIKDILKTCVQAQLYSNFDPETSDFSSPKAKGTRKIIGYAWNAQLIRKWSEDMVTACLGRSRWDMLNLMLSLNSKSVQKHCSQQRSLYTIDDNRIF